MTMPTEVEHVPKKCAKCGNDIIKREQLEMHSRWGFAGPAYRFNVYTCGNCGYSEFFYQKSTWI
ncbi:MAG: hypothetical protein SV910_01380 [Chloroflexota bacterium]|nr:hypothetical protein [Chloroflexota bacterium]